MGRGWIAAVAVGFLVVACGSEEDSGSNQLAEGGSGGIFTNDGGSGGSGGSGGDGGSGGVGGGGGAGGVGGTGGEEEPECSIEDFQSEACQACIASAILQCGTDSGCASGMIEFAACAANGGCIDDTGINYVCAALACPGEAAAVAQCISGCEAMRACAGL